MKAQTDYFGRLARQGTRALEAARALENVLTNYDFFALPEQLERLRAARKESTELRQALTEAVVEDFLPPLDRADLLAVSAGLEAVTSAAENALRQIFALQMAHAPSAFGALTRKLAERTTLAVEAAALLPKLKKGSDDILRLTQRIGTLARECDDLYAEALRELFSHKADSRELLACDRALQSLLACGTACDGLSDALALAVARNQ